MSPGLVPEGTSRVRANDAPMDAITLLKDDHKKVKALLKELEGMDDAAPSEKRAKAETVIRELMVHETIEEQVFYPAFKKAADEEGQALVAESKEEHHVVDLLMDELQAVDLDDPQFDAKMKVLQENVEHHIEEEEEKMFPDARKLLGNAKLQELGLAMEELKKSLLRSPGQKRESFAR